MTNKTKNFSFNTTERNIFDDQPKGKRNVGGRPVKKAEEKLSIQKTIKFTVEENKELLDDFRLIKTQYTSFASYLRHLVFTGKKHLINDNK